MPQIKGTLSPADVLAAYRQQTPSEVGSARVERVVQSHAAWTLGGVEINRLAFSAECVAARSSQRLIERYARLKTEAPPIIVEPGLDGLQEIVDGFHRVAAAQRRGERSIKAYFPATLDEHDSLGP